MPCFLADAFNAFAVCSAAWVGSIVLWWLIWDDDREGFGRDA